jgi:hypothetical protein
MRSSTNKIVPVICGLVAMALVIFVIVNKPTKNSNSREIAPGVVVTNNTSLQAPALGISITGQLSSVHFKNNEFRTTDFPGVIKVLKKQDNRDFLATIKEMVATEEKKPEDCLFEVNTPAASNDQTVTIRAKTDYEPTEQELFEYEKSQFSELTSIQDYREFCERSGPWCSQTRDGLVQSHHQNLCSSYAISLSYKDANYFQFDPAAGNEHFVYVHYETGGGDRPFIERVELSEPE